MILTKKQIVTLVAEGQMTEAVNAAMEFAEKCQAAPQYNALAMIAGQAEEHRQHWVSGVLTYEELSRNHAKLRAALLACLEDLPEVASPIQQLKLTDERVFKLRLFRLLLAVKVIVLSYIFYLWKTGGFTNEEGTAALSSLTPTFVAYISLMLSDFIRQSRNHIIPKRRYVSSFLVNVAWWLFPIYAIAQLYIITEKVKGNYTFLQMNVALTLCETMIGGYIGRMVEEFFKKEE